MPFDVQGVAVVAPESHQQLGRSLAEVAAVPREWTGLGWTDLTPFTLVVVPDAAGMQRWSRGSLPSWSAGAALPTRRTVVIRADAGTPFQTMRHELAHLAFHSRIEHRVPLWFSEGYAVLAAGEMGRLASLQLNLAVALGRVKSLRTVDVALRSGPNDAAAAYAMAGAAVAEVARRNPSGSLQPILSRMENGESFHDALVATTGFDPESFDEAWVLSTRRSYSFGLWLIAGGGWLILALLLGVGASLRRRRDLPRRRALNDGWELPVDESDEEPVGAVGRLAPGGEHDETPAGGMTVR